MTVELIMVGKTDSAAVSEIFSDYMKRINRYAKFSVTIIPDVKNTRNMPRATQVKLETTGVMKQIGEGDYVVLLDERGSEFDSVGFGRWLGKRIDTGVKRLVFVIGGPYGFGEELIRRSDFKLSLSRMTFPHQLVRAIFAEQLYRAFTIVAGEPYHHV